MMYERLIDQFLFLVLAVGWSLAFYLAKRALGSIDKKLDASFLRIDRTGKEMEKKLEKRDARFEKELRSLSAITSDELKVLNRKVEEKSRHDGEAVNRWLEGLASVYSKIYVSRQEFGAFTANINHKIDSIYQSINREGIKKK
jgi:Skp family chaperone for outer membrane proteins